MKMRCDACGRRIWFFQRRGKITHGDQVLLCFHLKVKCLKGAISKFNEMKAKKKG